MKVPGLVGLALLIAFGRGAAGQARGASPETLKASPEVAAALGAQSPKSAADLRLIESQLQKVVAQVLPATVGVQVGRAAGSGVIVNKEGLVLTAAHVIGRPGRRAWVELPDGRRLRGRTLGGDQDADGGMIQLDEPPADLPFAPASEGPKLKNGEWVVTIGQPGGIVEDRAPPVRFGRVLFVADDMVCTDCKLVGGDSGGPLFNMRGEVVGIHSSIGPMITHNFHVPITSFRRDWDRLVAGEMWGGPLDELEPGRPVLGVTGRTQDGRCLITQVFPELPGEKAGLEPGDLVLAVDGREIETFDMLKDIVYYKTPGTKLKLKVEREGKTIEMTAELGAAE